MAQSLSFILLHVVFSTRDRRALLDEVLRLELYSYLATVVRNAGCECYRVGGVADHVHLAVRLSRTMAVAALVGETKAASSKWLKERSPELHDFAWQNGYGVFSVGPPDLKQLIVYIDGQEAHHRKRDFKEEFRALLTKYGVEFDERYVWD